MLKNRPTNHVALVTKNKLEQPNAKIKYRKALGIDGI